MSLTFQLCFSFLNFRSAAIFEVHRHPLRTILKRLYHYLETTPSRVGPGGLKLARWLSRLNDPEIHAESDVPNFLHKRGFLSTFFVRFSTVGQIRGDRGTIPKGKPIQFGLWNLANRPTLYVDLKRSGSLCKMCAANLVEQCILVHRYVQIQTCIAYVHRQTKCIHVTWM